MAEKNFYLQIGADKLHFHKLEVNPDTGIAVYDVEQNLNEVFSSDPSVLEVTHLDYVPYLHTLWDGENFIDDQNRDKYPTRPNIDKPRRFSFLINNRHRLYMVLSDTETNAMKLAMLASDPKMVWTIE